MKRRVFIAVAGVLSLALLALVLTACSNAYVVYSTRDAVKTKPQDVEPTRVALVLGARVYKSGRPATPLRERLSIARDLYKSGTVQKIIVSGDHGEEDYDEVNVMRRWLIERGVSSQDIFMDHAGFRTLDSVVRAQEVFGADELVICTHRFHAYRAAFLASMHGISAQVLTADASPDPYRRQNQLREVAARTVAVADVLVGRGPKFLGPKIDLDGPSSQTHDGFLRP